MLKAIAYFVVIAVVCAAVLFFNAAGWQFALGFFCAICVYQFSHRYIHGRWIEF